MGFSLNVLLVPQTVGILEGFPSGSNSDLYINFRQIRDKVSESSSIVDWYRTEIGKLSFSSATPARKMRCQVGDASQQEQETLIQIFATVVDKIREQGLTG